MVPLFPFQFSSPIVMPFYTYNATYSLKKVGVGVLGQVISGYYKQQWLNPRKNQFYNYNYEK